MIAKHFICVLLTTAICCWAEPKTVAQIPVPEGFARIQYPKGSYSEWIAKLPLKETKDVKIFNGNTVRANYYNIFAVVDMPLLFKQDLEQCADYCFRFWGEFHKQRNALDKLYLFDYNGKKLLFKKSGKTYQGFLKWTMANANSHSLKMGCVDVSLTDIKPGDMIVQNEDGGIGHVSIVMDACESKAGEMLYLIGFSFMPAQEFHIEKAEPANGKEGWYTIDGYYDFLLEYLDLGTPIIKRFKES